MKAVIYSRDAVRSLRRHREASSRLRKAIEGYAADPSAHRNNVTPLVGSGLKRMRVGDWRIIFEETDAEIVVARIGPRGDVYD